MAQTYKLESHKYDGRYMYLQCEQTKNISNNTSTINWTLTVTGGSAGNYTTGPTTVKINDVTVYSKSKTAWDTYTFPAAKGSVSGTITVKHDDTGAAKIPVSITTNIYTGVLKTSNGTWTLDSIERFATLTSASNFTDEENPVIKYSNPAGAKVKSIKACISLDGSSADIGYKDLDPTGTSYTFKLSDSEKDVLRSATTSSNSRTVIFKLRTVIGDNDKSSILERTFTVANSKPTINPSIEDTNETSIALTGDKKKLVRYISNAKVTVNAKAVKKASLSSKSVTCGDKKLTADGTIKGITSDTFKFTAKDSRGNTATKTVQPEFINYIKPTCTIADNMPDTDGKLVIKSTGSYFNGFFGQENNALNVYYRYKRANDSWTDDNEWKHASKITLGNNKYTATTTITGLDYQTQYTVQAYARDVVFTTEVAETNVIATPIFDWGKSDFKFNVPVYDEYGMRFTGSAVKVYNPGVLSRDPNTTLEEMFLTAHDNGPKGRGGYFFVHNIFYIDNDRKNKTVESSRTQVAYSYHGTDTIYYRTYNRNDGGSWSSWIPVLSDTTHRMNLIWENSSITSSFAAQTITTSTSVSNYDGVIIIFKNVANSEVFMSSGFIPLGVSTMLTYSSTDGKNTYTRAATVSSSSISFKVGKDNGTESTNIIIPYKIYGVKGVTV